MGSAWKLGKTHISLERVIYSSVLDILHLWTAKVSPNFSCIIKRPWSPEVKNVPSAYIQSLPLWFCWWMELQSHCIALKNTGGMQTGMLTGHWGYLLIEEGKQISHHYKDRPGQGQEQFADVKCSLIEIIYSCRTEGDKVRGPPGHI